MAYMKLPVVLAIIWTSESAPVAFKEPVYYTHSWTVTFVVVLSVTAKNLVSDALTGTGLVTFIQAN